MKLVTGMARWLADPSTPAWVQAVGSVLAILVAIYIPGRQRSKSLRDAKADREREDREYQRRLTAGLRAEINAALEAAERQEFTIERTLTRLQQARERGLQVKQNGPIQRGSMRTTDAILYRQVAAELGQLPPELIRSIVLFYTLALDMGRLADAAPTAEIAYRTIRPLLSRLRMNAAILIRTLDKFESAQFSVEANINPVPDEIRALAAEVGYPLEEILREHGLAN